MIYIKIDNDIFYDDAVVMVKSFYPRTEVRPYKEDSVLTGEDMLIEAATPDIDGLTKRQMHDIFKKDLYLSLNEKTGKALPWGYLTGVRPSKNAYIMIEDGLTDEEILSCFIDTHFVKEDKARLALTVAKNEKKILDEIDYKNGYSLYIGIPFCPSICMYCSFSSSAISAYKDMVDAYLEALFKEMRFVAQKLKDRRLETVYFGGGTPTSISAEQLDRLLTELENDFDIENVRELTVEAGRPDSITIEKLRVLKKHNVGRISINPQTMNQETLDLIGRKHSVEQIKEAFALAREVGFDNINMDIILALPGEGVKEVEHTLDEILKLKPESLTVHSLAIKRAAALNIWRDKYTNLTFENTETIIEKTHEAARKLDMEPYYMYRQKNMAGNFENVGFSKKGMECIYNILIMEEKQTIIACGAGASTKIVFQDENRIERIENVKNVSDYVARIDEMIERKRAFFEENFKKL